MWVKIFSLWVSSLFMFDIIPKISYFLKSCEKDIWRGLMVFPSLEIALFWSLWCHELSHQKHFQDYLISIFWCELEKKYYISVIIVGMAKHYYWIFFILKVFNQITNFCMIKRPHPFSFSIIVLGNWDIFLFESMNVFWKKSFFCNEHYK